MRGTFRTDTDALAVYSEAAGIARILPRGVAVPLDVEDLVVLIRWASENDISLIPRGSGSSMPGGAIGDGVIAEEFPGRKFRAAFDGRTLGRPEEAGGFLGGQFSGREAHDI